MKKGFIGPLIIGVILVGIGVAGMLFVFNGQRILQLTSKGSTLTASEVEKLYSFPSTGVKVDKIANTIEFYSPRVFIPVIASPENGTMYSFGVYGLVNPTIIVSKGAEVTIQLVNMDDDMYHALMITAASPPYPYMGTMMFNRPAFLNAYIPPLPEEKDAEYSQLSTTFIASTAGTFYYICQVMGHASKGMYGKFIVNN